MDKQEFLVIAFPEEWPGEGEVLVDSLGLQWDEALAWDASGDKYKGRPRQVWTRAEMERIVAAYEKFLAGEAS